MLEKLLFRSAAALAVLMLLMGTAQAVTIDTVPVGNVGNAGDRESFYWGSVAYDYRIGKYEVTNAQYAEFLNAVAVNDPYGLYNTDMWSNDHLGPMIQRSGSPGSYSYSLGDNVAGRPVTYVSWGDAARFVNWLHNGRPAGAQGLKTTEDGAYFLNGAASGAALSVVSREADAKWVIPTTSEWFKAAHHDKSAGLAAVYFEYPTGTNTVPGLDMSETTTPGNNANYRGHGDPIDWPYHTTLVGEFELSDSPYGTFDQGGNVLEWVEERNEYLSRGLVFGGCFHFASHSMSKGHRLDPLLTDESELMGFRVASVPEPGSITLLVCASVAGLIWWRRRK